MPLATLVPFDRPLTGALIPGRSARVFTEAEVEEIRQQAYRQGGDAARAFADQQLVDMRTDVQHLQDGIFRRLAGLEPELLAQLQAALPGLALDLARRLLAGYEPPVEVIDRICREALDQLYPERENLELILSSRDAQLLTQLNPEWLQRYPGLRLRTDTALAPGDCQVRSRFGLTDARRAAKLDTLSLNLTHA
ncbi:MAG: FliH/SctL family protein [Opitutaceae bacterium]|nr:FliH/SctL family protein [Opitutaceae bacterium]